MPDAVPSPALDVHRVEVRPGVELAFWRARPDGGGGTPLLLLHGWPETKRIWARNVVALAAGGFDVVVPDLRGFGDTGPAADGRYDLASSSRDVRGLMATLGHDSFAACGGDFGGAVLIDLGLRHPGTITRQVLFNCPLPLVEGTPPLPARSRAAADYFRRQGREADALAAELRTPGERRRYVQAFYGPRFWATPGAFTHAEATWHAEPFEDADVLRASFGLYEATIGARSSPEPPRFLERVEVPTLVLYGPDDHVIPEDFPERAERVFRDLLGPFVVPRAGHFLQWERAELLNRTLVAFLRGPSPGGRTLEG